MNGGTCVDGGTLACVCLPGYGGDFCQTGWLHPFIIIIIVVVVVVLTHAPARVPDLEVCELGWDKFQGFCYRHFSSRQSWDAAEQHCRTCGGHLLSVMTPEEQQHVNGQPSTIANIHAALCLRPLQQRLSCFFREVPRVSVDRPERQNHRGGLPLVGREPSGQVFTFTLVIQGPKDLQ